MTPQIQSEGLTMKELAQRNLSGKQLVLKARAMRVSATSECIAKRLLAIANDPSVPVGERVRRLRGSLIAQDRVGFEAGWRARDRRAK